MIEPSPERSHGTHNVQGVLLRAGPGTGKTVSLHQLTRLIALRLQAESKGGGSGDGADGGASPPAGIGLVPLLLSVQRLATYMNNPKNRQSGAESDLLREFIISQHEGARRDMLLQVSRSLHDMCTRVCGVGWGACIRAPGHHHLVPRLFPPPCLGDPRVKSNNAPHPLTPP